MGQSLSGHADKRSRLQNLNRNDELPSRLEASAYYTQNLALGLGSQDLLISPRWHPQEITNLAKSNTESFWPSKPARRLSKISLLPRDTGCHQYDSLSNNSLHDDSQAYLISKKLKDYQNDEDSILSPKEGKVTENDENATDSDSITLRSLSHVREERNLERRVLMREVHRLLRSASLDDMSRVSTYLKIQGLDSGDESFSDEKLGSQFSRPKRRGISSRSQLIARESEGDLLHRQSSIHALSSRTSHEHIVTLKPSSAYLSSLRPSSSYQSSSYQSSSYQSSARPISRNNSISTQRSDDFLPLSRHTSSTRTLRSTIFSSVDGSSSSASSLWSPTSEANDVYRIALITNLHYCTYGCKDQKFNRKLDWISHEELVHERPVIHTCLLHVSDLSSDPCPATLCVATMDIDHLENFHDSSSCFDKPTAMIERYQTESADLLLEHLWGRHGLKFDTFPDDWSSESKGKSSWRCGFCGGILMSWKERADHISIHFTREGLTIADWKEYADMPTGPDDGKPMVIGVPRKVMSLGQLRRLSVIGEC